MCNHLALLPHSKEAWVRLPGRTYASLCGACMLPLCQRGFSPGAPALCEWLFVCLICPAVGWRPAQVVPSLSPAVSWDRLQPLATPNGIKRLKMDGWPVNEHLVAGCVTVPQPDAAMWGNHPSPCCWPTTHKTRWCRVRGSDS